MTRAPGLGVSVILVACATIVCGGGRAPNDAPALRPVALPDLTTASPTVRKQLDAHYSSLQRAMQAGGSTAGLGTEFGTMAMLLIAADDYEASEPYLLNARDLAPADARWPYLLAQVYKRVGRLEEAANWFGETVRLEPSNTAAYIWLGDTYLSLGRLDAADAALGKALTVGGESAAVLARLGQSALARGDYPRAVQLLEKALKLAPGATSLNQPIAMGYRAMGDLQSAERHLRQRGSGDVPVDDPLIASVDEMLDSPMSFEARGREALARGEWTTAVEQFRKGIEAGVGNPALLSVLHQQLGTGLYQLGDTSGALAEFEQAVRDAPESAKAQFSAGVLLLSMGRDRQAVAHLEAAVTADPRDAQSRLQLALALRAVGRTAEAAAQYEQAVKLDPGIVQRQ